VNPKVEQEELDYINQKHLLVSEDVRKRWRKLHMSHVFGVRIAKTYKSILNKKMQYSLEAPSKNAGTLSFILKELVHYQDDKYISIVDLN
jgi:hypothetical protein